MYLCMYVVVIIITKLLGTTSPLAPQAAVPVKEAARSCGDRGHTEVEMDPVSSFHANERIRSLGMQVKGFLNDHCLRGQHLRLRTPTLLSFRELVLLLYVLTFSKARDVASASCGK